MVDFEAIAENIQKLKAAIDELPVVPVVEPGDVRKILETEFSFDRPVDAGELYKRVNDLLKKSVMQVTNPRYFGYFNPSVRVSSVVGDMLAAVYNPNLAIWSHSPAGIEIEKHVLDFFMRRFGLDPEAGIAHFTSGGAEANLTAALVALTDKFPEYGDAGLTGIDARPVMYVPATAHDSFVKICHMTGLGRNALRTIGVDDTLRLDVAALREQVRVDRENGYTPFFAVGTAGTTAAGIVDPPRRDGGRLPGRGALVSRRRRLGRRRGGLGSAETVRDRHRPRRLHHLRRTQMDLRPDGRRHVLLPQEGTGRAGVPRRDGVHAAEYRGDRRAVRHDRPVVPPVYRAEGLPRARRNGSGRLRGLHRPHGRSRRHP